MVIMFVPVRVIDKHSHTIDLPKPFLNHLLSSGYRLGDEDILCVRLTSPFSTYYCAMGTFTQDTFLEIPCNINEQLNVVDDMLIQMDRVPPVAPKTVVLQAHNDSFHKIPDLKEQLDKSFLDTKIINRGCLLYLQGDTVEPYTVLRILDEDGEDMEWAATVECDVNIDFEETLEGIRRREEQARRAQEEKERRELEARGYLGEGHTLGGAATSRQTWLDRLEREREREREQIDQSDQTV